MLSTSGNWLFVHTPRTGGNSLQRALVGLSDDHLVTGARWDGIDRFEVSGPHTPRKHATAAEYLEVLGAERFGQLFKFATVRNPWERAISWYFAPFRWSHRAKEPNWLPDEFAADIDRLAPIVSFVCVDGELAVDTLLRYERFAHDAQALLRRLGSGEELPHANASVAHEPWERYYAESPELVDVVGERFGADAELFGYDPPAV